MFSRTPYAEQKSEIRVYISPENDKFNATVNTRQVRRATARALAKEQRKAARWAWSFR